MAKALPPFVRYADEESHLYILEFPPQVKGINIRTQYDWEYRGGEAKGLERMLVPLPWQVYICKPVVNRVQFFTRVARLRSINDVLNFPHISNIYRDCTPCGGVGLSRAGVPDLEHCIGMINYIWSSSFQGGFYLGGGNRGYHELAGEKRDSLLPKTMTDHLGGSKMYYDGTGSMRYYKWVERLKPADLLKWEWTPAGKLADLAGIQPKTRLRRTAVLDERTVKLKRAAS